MLKFLVVGSQLEILQGTTRIAVLDRSIIGLDATLLYLDTPIIRLYNVRLGALETIFSAPLSDVDDESDVTFTVNSIIAYAEANFGIILGGSGGTFPIAYIGYSGADDSTAELGNIGKSWASLDQAMQDTVGLGYAFIQYRIADDKDGVTYEINSQFSTYIAWEIKSKSYVFIDFGNNTNTSLYLNTNPPSFWGLNYFNIPNGVIKCDNGRTRDFKIGGEDWLIRINVKEIDNNQTGTLFAGNFGIYFEQQLQKLTHQAGFLCQNTVIGDIEIYELATGTAGTTQLWSNTSPSIGIVTIQKITGTAGFLTENNSSVNKSRWRIGDIATSNATRFRYDNCFVEFLQSKITTDILLSSNANDNLYLSGIIQSCTGKIYCINNKGTIRFDNFSGDLGTASEIELQNAGKCIARNSTFLVDTVFGNVNAVTIGNTPFEFHNSSVYQRTLGNLINGTLASTETIILDAFKTNANTINTSSPTIQIEDTSLTPHGAYGMEANVTATIIGSSGTYTKVLGVMTANLLQFFTYTADNRLVYTGERTRNFTLNANPVSMIAGSNNVIVSLKFAKNGAVVGYPLTRKIGTGSDIGAGSLSFDVSLAKNDYIELFVTNETNTATVTIEDLYVSAKELL